MLTAEEVRHAFHYLYPAELPALKELVLSLPNDPIVINIGAGSGTSGLLFVETRGDLTLHTIDIQDESSPFGCLEAERDVMRRAGLADQFNVRWFQWHVSSHEFYYLNSFNADMVFVDGDHSYEGCRDDILGYLPMIKPGGIIAVHDYDKGAILIHDDGPHPRVWDTVNRAVDEFLVGKFEQIVRVDSLIAFRV